MSPLRMSDLPGRIQKQLRADRRIPDPPVCRIDRSGLEDCLYADIRRSRLVLPERQYRFAVTRKWRLDFAWPSCRLALEVQGGTWVRGGHVRGRQYERDCEKLNAAQLAGWTVLLVTGDMVRNRKAIELVRTALEQVGGWMVVPVLILE